MRFLTLKLTLVVSSLILFCTSKAQNAFNTGLNGTTINLPCNVNCAVVPVKIPHLKSSSSYTASAIPYNPYPFTSATGTEVTETYVDDKFSHLQTMPFSFCFYDSTFDKFVVGSNGVISFDISNVDCGNDWKLETRPIPFLGNGTCANAFDTQYTKYSVMGVYHDINPSITKPGKKIEWRIEGVAPFRRLIVSFNNIALFGDNNQLHTSQIVLYESTGVIEVYIKDKPRDMNGGVAWNGDLAIVGVQKDNTLATAVAGKNCQIWEEHNTAYQFVPSGGASRFVKAEVLNINHTFIALGDTATTTAGVLDVTFPDLCPLGTTGQYVIKTTFKACDNMMTEMVSFDTITINKTNSLNATSAVTPTSCGMSGTGTATVTIPANLGTAPFTYVLTPVSPAGAPVTQITTNVFTGLSAGTYTIAVTDAGGSCGNNLPITIVSTGVLAVDYTAGPTSCFGAANGTLNVVAPNGTPPFTYIVTPESPPNAPITQSSGAFNNLLAGNYFLTVKDNAGCQAMNLPFTVDAGPSITLDFTMTPTSCLGANNGSIQLNPSGTAPFLYSINGGVYGPSNPLTGLPAGTHFVSVSDAIGCKIIFYPITVDAGNGTLTGTATAVATSCTGASNGSVTVTPTSGSGPYQYSINNGVNWQTNNIFNGLATGNYTVTIREGGLCLSNGIPVTVPSGSALLATLTPTATSCNGAADGKILVNPTNGTAPYQYTLDAGVPQASNTFVNVSAGNHTVRVRDASGCISAAIPISVAAGPALTGTASSTATACAGVNNGTITVTATNGTPPYTYVIDGGAAQASNVFNNVSAGNHTVVIRNASGCSSAPFAVTVATGTVVNATVLSTSTACVGVNNGSITVTPLNGSAPYTYSLDGGVAQSSNVFTGVSAGSHTIMVRDNFGCTSNNLAISVAAGTVLTGQATPTAVSCNGGNDGSITANGTNGSAPYQYSLNGGASQPGNSFTGLVAGSYTITITDAFGCISAPININVDQPAVLNASIGFSRNVNCQGETNGLIRINTTGGTAPYVYSINAAAYQPIDSFVVNAGVYNVTVRDAKNCITVVNNIVITEPAALTATIAGTTNASCDGGDDGTITINANGGTVAYQYSLDGSNFQATNILRARPGTYTITVKDAHNCTFTIAGVTVGLTSNLVLAPTPDPAPICEGSSVQLNLQTNATGFQWTPGTATGLNSATIMNPIANPVQTTLYTVVVTLGSCTATDDINVVVMQAPIPNAGPDAEICYGQDYQLQASGGVSYNWTPATYLSYTSTNNPQVVQPAKTITYTLSVVDANNCPSLVTDQVTITVIPPIKVKVTPLDTVVHAGDQVQLNAYSIGTNYDWTPYYGLSNPKIPNPVATAVGQDGDVVTYQVTASTAAGCKGEGYATIRIFKGPDLYVANAFTPNNDGKNDLFVPFPVGIKELKYFKVFNRWGQLIYSTSSLHQGWDGKFGGAEQPGGVYVWTAQAITKDNQIITKKGSVTLIR